LYNLSGGRYAKRKEEETPQNGYSQAEEAIAQDAAQKEDTLSDEEPMSPCP
jgi:hypothetical protein